MRRCLWTIAVMFALVIGVSSWPIAQAVADGCIGCDGFLAQPIHKGPVRDVNLFYQAPPTKVWVPVAQPAPQPVRRQAVAALAPRASGTCYAEPGTPPQSVLDREVGGAGYRPNVHNFSGSGAAGCWQFMPRTWGGYGGYASAADAPISVQNERAKQVWNGGAGCGHWGAC